MKKTLAILVGAACAGLVAAVSVARPAANDGTLQGSVGPGFQISLTQNGSRVTNLAPGTYTINVNDLATEHDFHLQGPGVDQSTTVPDTGTVTWTVTLTDGTYSYFCDAHPGTMLGTFTVGTAPATTTTTTTTPPPPPPPFVLKSTATVVGRTVTLKAKATRTASFDFALLRGTTRVAHVTKKGKTATARLKAPKAGRYTARVVAKAGTIKKTTLKKVTIR
jgi:plastocyanin